MPSSPPEIIVVPREGLDALEGEWAELWRRCPDASPFQAPAWLMPWARHYAPGRCSATTLRAGGRLVGIAPVFCWEGAILLAGTGPSDHGGPLIEPGAGGSAVHLLAALRAAAPERWDRIDLQQLAPGSSFFDAAPPPGWREERIEGDACLVAPLDGEDGLGAVAPWRRAKWRRALRLLEGAGAVLGLARGAEVADAMADLLRLHAARWEARGETGVLADPLLGAFLQDAAPRLEAAGLLRLHQVVLGGQRIAVVLALAGQATLCFYIGGFDPAQARLSPSAALIGAAMAQAHGEGAVRADFLRGHEPYKSDWGAVPVPLHRRVLRPPPAGEPARLDGVRGGQAT